ncbi:MAG: caspase family protein [Burkholderiales bacterium]|nr:caspase family protein [Burkholderiales bacterium]OJX00588.1 MAG: hypothetical protein BGO72_10960 [Burkholderiales bacterium 70-64]
MKPTATTDAPPARLFVAIAIATYAKKEDHLETAVTEAMSLATPLRDKHDFKPIVLEDPKSGELGIQIREALPEPEQGAHEGTLIVYWTGHGERDSEGGLRLLTFDGKADSDQFTATYLVELAAKTGARQVLVLIDTCHAGAALGPVAKAVQAAAKRRADPSRGWFGCVATCVHDKTARSDQFSSTVARLLDKGPSEGNAYRLHWLPNLPTVKGTDFLNTLEKEWAEVLKVKDQRLDRLLTLGAQEDLLNNPLYEPGLDGKVIDDLLWAARGRDRSDGQGSSDESHFTGRKQPLARLVAWLQDTSPGLCVVTGSAGCGKSALIGRIASLSARDERPRLLNEELPPECDPGEDSIAAQLSLYGADPESAGRELARQLHLGSDESLLSALAHVEKTHRTTKRAPAVILDGLNEAREHLPRLVGELVLPLARHARIIAATRPSAEEVQVLKLLQDGAVELRRFEHIDLDEDPDTTADLHDYVIRRLQDVDPAMDAERVARVLTPLGGGDKGSVTRFLLARLITSQLREQPVDTSEPGWEKAVPATAQLALKRDLEKTVSTAEGTPLEPAAVRALLRALVYSHGAGFPADNDHDLWPAVASALSAPGMRCDREAANAVVKAFGRYIIVDVVAADAEDGRKVQTVYRMAHQELVDYLGSDERHARSDRRDVRATVADAVHDAYSRWLKDGGDPRDHAYLWNYAWLHLAEAGAPGLQQLEDLAGLNREAFLPDLAAGYAYVGESTLHAGNPASAMAMLEKAVEACRELNDPSRLVVALIQLSRAHMFQGQNELAAQAAGEARQVAQRIPDAAIARRLLGRAMLAAAILRLQAGDAASARRLAGEVLDLAQDDGEAETRWLLAGACNVCAGAFMMLDKLGEARDFLERAGELSSGDTEADRFIRLETQAHWACLQFFEAWRQVQAGGEPTLAPTDAGEYVLREWRSKGRRGDIGDVLIAKGLLYLALSRDLNEIREPGPATSGGDGPIGLLDRVVELTQSRVESNVEAAQFYAAALEKRAEMELRHGDRAAAMHALDDAIACLRRFPRLNGSLAATLGELLTRKVGFSLQDPRADRKELAEAQEEAIHLLRPMDTPLLHLLRAQALSQSAMLLQGSPLQALAVREQAIDLLRELAQDRQEAKALLLRLLPDQSAQLLMSGRAGEASERAAEAIRLAGELPSDPPIAYLASLARVNRADAQVALGRLEGVREMLDEALDSLQKTVLGELAALGKLVEATAHLGLSRIDAMDGRWASSLEHAQHCIDAVQALNRSVILPEIRDQLPDKLEQASILLGGAKRRSEDPARVEEGRRILEAVLAELPEVVAGSDISAARIASLLHIVAPDLRDSVRKALNGHPALWQRLELARPRMPEELPATVAALVEALAAADPAAQRELRHIARQHRQSQREALDAAWSRLQGEIPGWLMIEPHLEWLVISWLNTDDRKRSRDYLCDHWEELRGADTDLVLEEIALGLADRTGVDRRLELLAEAREQGVEAAYAPWLLKVEIERWLFSANPREHLERHPELQRQEVQDMLRSLAGSGDAAAQVLFAVFGLVQLGEADLAFDSLANPQARPDRLQAACEFGDADLLWMLATIVYHQTGDEEIKRKAAVALRVAQVLCPEAAARSPDGGEVLASIPPAQLQALLDMVMSAMKRHPPRATELAALLSGLARPTPAATLSALQQR